MLCVLYDRRRLIEHSDCQRAAIELVAKAESRGTSDNTSVVICCLNQVNHDTSLSFYYLSLVFLEQVDRVNEKVKRRNPPRSVIQLSELPKGTDTSSPTKDVIKNHNCFEENSDQSSVMSNFNMSFCDGENDWGDL